MLDAYGGQPIDQPREFHLSADGWLEFDTPPYLVPVEVNGQPLALRVGRVPDGFASTMQALAGMRSW